MARPAATNRGARRNEAHNGRKANAGKRVAMITFKDILRINAMRQQRMQREEQRA
jgi:hypothetical protein